MAPSSMERAARKNSLLVPCTLLAIASTLVVLHHIMYMTEENSHHQITRAFLIVLVMTMMPLAYVDATISRCNDPIALLHKFGIQVVLMHAVFLSLRATSRSIAEMGDIFDNKGNMAGTLGAWITLVVGFREQLADIKQYLEVGVLYLLAFLAGAVTIKLSPHIPFSFWFVVDSASDYGEVLAFVPAAWIIFRSQSKKDEETAKVAPEVSTRRALSLTLLTVGFYVVEDVVTMFLTARTSPFEAFAHALHFFLLVDFGMFMISYARNPDQSQGTMLTRFGEALGDMV